MSPQIGLPHECCACETKPTCDVTSVNCWRAEIDGSVVTKPPAVHRQVSILLMPRVARHNFPEPPNADLVGAKGGSALSGSKVRREKKLRARKWVCFSKLGNGRCDNLLIDVMWVNISEAKSDAVLPSEFQA